MGNIKENRDCYVSPRQRLVLIELLKNSEISESFFLTGGTALSVFYLHHRTSEDIDLFSGEGPSLGNLVFWTTRHFMGHAVPVRESDVHSSLLIDEVKVDLVIDRLSFQGDKTPYSMEEGVRLNVDSIENIASNKFCTVISRTEPKDFIDLSEILKKYPHLGFDGLYKMARQKDAVFDDPPTAAFQLEENLKAVVPLLGLYRPMLKGPFTIDERGLSDFFRAMSDFLYSLVRK